MPLQAIPLPVSKIIVLTSKNSEGFERSEVKGIEKFNQIKNNTYRFQYVDALGQSAIHFAMSSRLANAVDVIQVKRPSSPLLLEELGGFCFGGGEWEWRVGRYYYVFRTICANNKCICPVSFSGSVVIYT